MARVKPNNLAPKTNVVKIDAPKAEGAAATFDPVDIVRTLPDGREIRRQCDRPDLPAFEARGFKAVKVKAAIDPDAE